jgi:hypothetical protein
MRTRLAARFQRQSDIRRTTLLCSVVLPSVVMVAFVRAKRCSNHTCSGRTTLAGRSVIKCIWISRWDLPNPRMILALLERR